MTQIRELKVKRLMKSVRVFISSPGDVQEERERARSVIHQLSRRYAGRLQLEAVLWEDIPLQATMSFQQGIDVLLSSHGVDIAVFILWSRLGSPLGKSIAKPDGSSYLSGTEREWDLMLRAREASAKESESPRPDILVYTRRDDAAFFERLRARNDTERQTEISQKQLLGQFIQEEFRDAETGHNIRAYHSFDQPTTFAQQLRAHLVNLLDRRSESIPENPIWNIDEQGPPFRGLDVFEFEHAPIFFGREDEIVSVRQLLREQACRGCAFVLISGNSGSGKSSLARAGVLPDIVEFEIDKDVQLWRWLVTNPQQWGQSPLNGFLEALCADTCLPELKRYLHDLDFSGAQECFLSWLSVLRLRIRDTLQAVSPREGQARLVILIDQLEELFAGHNVDETSRRWILSALETLARSGSVWILVTVRSDFYHHCQDEPILVRLKEGSGQFDLLPATSDALARLINGPAALAGLQFERTGEQSLSDLILREAAEHKELLPVVEHLLTELCRQRTEDGTLTFATYRELGGIEGALRRHCDDTLESLPVSVQNRFDLVFSELISLSGDSQESFVRRSAPMTLFTNDADSNFFVQAFIDARLFTTGTSIERGATVSVAHEVLLRTWPKVTDWISGNREFLRLRATIEQYQKRWQSNQRDPSLLLPIGLPLEEGRHLLEIGSNNLAQIVLAYVNLSIAAEREQQQRATKGRRFLIAGLSAIALLLGALGLYSSYQANLARKAQRSAETASQQASQARQVADQERDRAVKAQDITKTTLGKLTERSVAASETLFDFASNDFESYRTDNSQTKLESSLRKLHQAWTLRSDEDSLKAIYARLLLDRSTLGSRIWLKTPFQAGGDRTSFGICCSANGKQILAMDGQRLGAWDLATGISQPDVIEKSDAYYHIISASPDGRQLFAADLQGNVYWYSTESAKIVSTYKTDGIVEAVAFNGATCLIAIVSPQALRIADAHTGDPIGEPIPHDKERIAMAFSPDLDSFVIAKKNQIEIWGLLAFKRKCEPIECDGAVRSVAFSPDGGHVVAGGEGAMGPQDGTLSWWDAETGLPTSAALKLGDIVFEFSWNPDGSQFATRSLTKVQLWNSRNKARLGAEIDVIPGDDVLFTPDGSHLVLADSHHVQLRDTREAWKSIGQAIDASSSIERFLYSPDGSQVATAANNTIRVWNATSGLAMGPPLKHRQDVLSMEFSRDGTRILSGTHTAAYLWDMRKTSAMGEPMTHGTAAIKSVTFSPNGEWVVTGSEDRTAQLWDGKTGNRIGNPMQHESPIDSALFSPDSRRITTVCGHLVQGWDPKNSSRVGEPFQLKEHMYRIISPRGDRIVSFGYDEAELWDTQTGKVIKSKIELKNDMPPGFNASGSKFTTVSNEMLTVRDATTGEPLGEPIRQSGSAEFNADGTQFASFPGGAMASHSIHFYDASSSLLLCEPLTSEIYFRSFAFSPDSCHFATLSDDSQLRIWELPRITKAKLRLNPATISENAVLPTEWMEEDEARKFFAWRQYLYRSSTAIEAVENKQWFTAKFHLPWLLKHEPENQLWKTLSSKVPSGNEIFP